MSGFVAVVNLDGAPIDPVQLQRMTDALSFRGPDAREVWIGGQVGFGHAMLRTTDEALHERQPCSVDGAIWITGDVRVDRRAELMRALEAAGRTPANTATDPELVLHAYQAWGDALVDHLLGDFSFAIWDCDRRRLFCARDQLGVKPFFHARVGDQLIVSNTLACVRAHGSVPATLNDAAVGDFLLFGFNCDPGTTTFEAIRRLPGGHTLSWTPGGEPRITRYWTLPVYDKLRLPRATDYVERFRGLLADATSDRLRNDRVGIHMSGGLDSSLIAATARGLMTQRASGAELRAHTVVYDRLFQDEERHYSGVVARSLGIPIKYLAADDFELFDEGGDGRSHFPEPLDVLSKPSFFNAVNRQMGTEFRVALTGWDGDALLSASWPAHLASQARHRDFGGLAADVFRYARVKQNLVGAFARRLRWPRRNGPSEAVFPTWLQPDFERRMGLRERWMGMFAAPDLGRGTREGAYQAMGLQTWLPILEARDAGVSGVPVDHRHPLLDLRMIEFGLSLPAIPWCVDKHIMRAAARDVLPKSIRKRPKSALGGDPMPFAIRDYLAQLRQPLALHPALGKYVDLNRLPQLIAEAGSDVYSLALRVFIFNYWIFSVESEPK